MAYQDALTEYLAASGLTQAQLAEKVGLTQPAICRYVDGRLPSIDAARLLDERTNGAIPFSSWQAEKAAALGLAA